MSENPYNEFIENVRDSIKAVMVVAEWAVIKGADVEIKGMKFAKSYKEWKDNADEGFDIIIKGKSVNVKKSTKTFFSVNEFVSNFKNYDRPILVCPIHIIPPDIVLILSADYNGGIIISKEHQKHWGIRENVFDPRYNTTQNCYDVGVDYVTWFKIK